MREEEEGRGRGEGRMGKGGDPKRFVHTQHVRNPEKLRIEDRAVKFAYSRGFSANCGSNDVCAIFIT